MTGAVPLKPGPIGDCIARFLPLALHGLAGRQCGPRVSFDRPIPADPGQDVDSVFAACGAAGYRANNVTFPCKERAVPLVRVDDPLIAASGAVNTVLLEPAGHGGHDADLLGFIGA